jgi:hypothetical protein
MADIDNVDPNEFSDLNNPDDGRSDPDKRFPRKEYVGVSGVNNIARGTRVANVYIGGSVPGVDLELNDEPSAQYPENQVKETSSGHIIEYDDTNGRERVMIRHRTGSGVEMRADGTVIYSSTNNAIRIVAANEKVIVEGDGEVVYNGNLKMKVAGDFDLEVGGDFNVNVVGDKEEVIKSNSIQTIAKNKTTEIGQNKAETIVGADTQTVLSNKTQIIKGDFDNIVKGVVEVDAGGNLVMTSESKFISSSPNTSIVASCLSVISDSSTFGGANVTAYFNNIFAKSATFTEGVTGPTFHGDVKGTADKAVEAQRAGTAGAIGASGSASAPTDTATNTVQTSQPNTAMIASGLRTSPVVGIRQVEVDTFDDLKYTINKSRNYGGISETELNTKSVRSKLRDPNTIANETFVGEAISEGLVSKNFANTLPPQFGKSVSIKDKSQRGSEPMGPSNPKSKVYQT